MKDEDKTKEQLINELGKLRQRVAELEAAEAELWGAKARYRSLFERVPVGLYRSTPEGRILDANPALVQMLGYPDRESLLVVKVADLYVDAGAYRLWQALMEQDGRVNDFEMRLRRRDGTAIWVWNTAQTIHDAQGRVLCYEGSIQDITERKWAEEAIRELAFQDPLTGLPNRLLFNDRLTLELARARRNQQKLAVMLLDLDDFKEVNDTLGRSVGDQLLQAVGDRLTSLLRRSDTVARSGDDEFTLLLPGISRREDAVQVAQKTAEAVRRPFVLDDHELHITTSIGIALYPDDSEDEEALIKNAKIAMYRAKEQGRDNYQHCTSAANAKAT